MNRKMLTIILCVVMLSIGYAIGYWRGATRVRQLFKNTTEAATDFFRQIADLESKQNRYIE